jgi:precorrin-6B methylase 1
MKKSEIYINEYPLEDLLPELDEKEVGKIVNSCDYNIEASQIAKEMNMPEVNDADAVVFYTMGYEAAKKVLEKKLKPAKQSDFYVC